MFGLFLSAYFVLVKDKYTLVAFLLLVSKPREVHHLDSFEYSMKELQSGGLIKHGVIKKYS